MNRICELRKQNKLTQKALAEKLQVDQSAVSYWECGRAFPDTQKQIMLADLFGVSIDYVLGRDVPKGMPPGSIPEVGEQLVLVQPQAPAPPPPPQAKYIKVYSSLNAAGFASIMSRTSPPLPRIFQSVSVSAASGSTPRTALAPRSRRIIQSRLTSKFT